MLSIISAKHPLQLITDVSGEREYHPSSVTLKKLMSKTVFEAESGVSEYEKLDLQAYEKQADKLVKQLKKYHKDYEYVTFESSIHGDLRKTDVERIRKFFETGT